MKQLVVNADDFGFSTDVNRGIIEAHERGILTATTLMANGPAFADALARARDCPTLDVGCHFVLLQGPSLARRGASLPQSWLELVSSLFASRLDPYEEFRAQLERILAAGIRPLHVDTHKHTHLLPPVLKAVARLCHEYSIPWVRRPADLPLHARSIPPMRRISARAARALSALADRQLAAAGLRTTDHFAGFQITGRFRATELIHLISRLPEGLTELMCHPGFCTQELMSMPTRLKQSREEELRALLHPAVRAALMRHQVTLVRYRDLS